MSKVLIVTPINKRIKNNTGGTHVNSRNIRVLKDVFGSEKTDVYEILYYNNKIQTFFYNLFGYSTGVKRNHIKDIISLCKNYDYIFFNTTLFGKIIKKIKCNCKTIVFAHNCEFDFTKQSMKNMWIIKKIFRLPMLLAVYSNESKSLKYSNTYIAINKRDSDCCKKYYKRSADFYMPISFPDCFNNIRKKEDKSKYLLFVGSDFYGNTEGLFWFIKEVLPKINLQLVVIGSGMEKYSEFFKNEKVHFYGFIDDLSEYYENASAVVLPIISGSGMKTKTAESLMYGKYIFGTTEAFSGYDIEPKRIGAICNTAEDFIEAINSFAMSNVEKYNKYARELFLKKYSDEAITKLLEDFFNT